MTGTAWSAASKCSDFGGGRRRWQCVLREPDRRSANADSRIASLECSEIDLDVSVQPTGGGSMQV